VLEISLNPEGVLEMREIWQVCPRHVDYSDAIGWFLVLCGPVPTGRVVSFQGVLSCHSLPMVPAVC